MQNIGGTPGGRDTLNFCVYIGSAPALALYLKKITWAQNYNAALKIRPILDQVINFDLIFYHQNQ